MIDRDDLRSLAIAAVVVLLATVAVLWATGIALLVRFLWGL